MGTSIGSVFNQGLQFVTGSSNQSRETGASAPTQGTLVADLRVGGSQNDKNRINFLMDHLTKSTEGRVLASWTQGAEDRWNISIDRNIGTFGVTDLNNRTIKLKPDAGVKTLANELTNAAIAEQSKMQGITNIAQTGGRYAEAASSFIGGYMHAKASGQSREQAVERGTQELTRMIESGAYNKNVSKMYNPAVDEVVRLVAGKAGLDAFKGKVDEYGFAATGTDQYTR